MAVDNLRVRIRRSVVLEGNNIVLLPRLLMTVIWKAIGGYEAHILVC